MSRWIVAAERKSDAEKAYYDAIKIRGEHKRHEERHEDDASERVRFVGTLLEGSRAVDDTATLETRIQARKKSVQEHIDELPMWATELPQIGANDRHAVADLVARGRRQVLRRFRRLHDRCRTTAAVKRVRHYSGRERTDHRSDFVRHPRRRCRPRRVVGPFGRKIMFLVEMVISGVKP